MSAGAALRAVACIAKALSSAHTPSASRSRERTARRARSKIAGALATHAAKYGLVARVWAIPSVEPTSFLARVVTATHMATGQSRASGRGSAARNSAWGVPAARVTNPPYTERAAETDD